MRFFKSRELGALETAVMEIVWDRGERLSQKGLAQESSVHDVSELLTRPLAYTTVMTTLDRLYKKGLLDRRKSDRAFLYKPRFSRREWDEKRAGELVSGLLASRQQSGELLISCLVDAVGQQDAALLDELERKIRAKRRELERRSEA
jgi:predicted transcriptional regulator